MMTRGLLQMVGKCGWNLCCYTAFGVLPCTPLFGRVKEENQQRCKGVCMSVHVGQTMSTRCRPRCLEHFVLGALVLVSQSHWPTIASGGGLDPTQTSIEVLHGVHATRLPAAQALYRDPRGLNVSQLRSHADSCQFTRPVAATPKLSAPTVRIVRSTFHVLHLFSWSTQRCCLESRLVGQGDRFCQLIC